MIVSFLRIIDRLIDLKSTREGRNKELFHEVYEPIYRDMLTIHTDYNQILERAQEILPSRDKEYMLKFASISFHDVAGNIYNPLERLLPPPRTTCMSGYAQRLLETAEMLKRERVAFEPVRISVLSLSIELKEIGIKGRALDFVNAVILYFPEGCYEDEIFRRYHSVTTGIYRAIITELDNINENVPSSSIFDLIDGSLFFNRSGWNNVAQTFAKLKLESLSV